MKTLFLFLTFYFISVLSFGQIHFGLKAGANVNNITNSGDTTPAINTSSQPLIGWHIGVFSEIKLGEKLNLIPELQYSQRGWAGTTGISDYRSILNYLEMPILISINVIKKLDIQIGPNLGYLFSAFAKDKDKGSKIYTYNNLRKLDFGLTGGVQYILSEKISLISRYYFGMQSFEDISIRINNGNSIGTHKRYNRTIQLGISYLLW